MFLSAAKRFATSRVAPLVQTLAQTKRSGLLTRRRLRRKSTGSGVAACLGRGRIRGKAPKPGRYEALFSASDKAGIAKPEAIGFTMRWALFEAAQTARRTGSPDHDYYEQAAERIGGKPCLPGRDAQASEAQLPHAA
jgi:hypothetical protein